MQHYFYHIADISKLDRNDIVFLIGKQEGEGWEFFCATETRLFFRKARH